MKNAENARTLAEMFTHAHFQDWKNRNSWAGHGACSSRHVLSKPGPISAASAVASCSWNRQRRKLFAEFVTAKRLVCKNGHTLVEPLSRVFYMVSVSTYFFVDERSFFRRALARIALTIHDFRREMSALLTDP